MQLAFPESFFAVQLSRCAARSSASLENDTEIQFANIQQLFPFFERSLTFRFASLKLLDERFLFHIDLGFGVRLSASAFSLERR